MGRKGPATVFSAALHLVQIACAFAVIIIVPWKLYRVDSFDLSDVKDLANNPSLDEVSKCLFDSRDSSFLSGASFCLALLGFAVATVILSTLAGCAKFCLKCITANAFGLSNVVLFVADVILAVAWGVAFYFVLTRGQAANDIGLPNESYRNGVIAASFFSAASYALDAVAALCLVGA